MYRILDSSNENNTFTNEALEQRRRQILLNKDPLLVAWFFKERSKAFIQEILFKKFDVIDFWYRIEFQHRGSPHIHGFIWFNGAPNVIELETMNEEQRQQVIDYFEQIISESSPDYSFSIIPLVNPCKINFSDVENHEMYSSILNDNRIRQTMARHLADYKNLIQKVQRHTRCTSSCLRTVPNQNSQVCRYGFDKELVSESKIERNQNTNNFELKMKRNDSKINNHCPAITIH